MKAAPFLEALMAVTVTALGSCGRGGRGGSGPSDAPGGADSGLGRAPTATPDAAASRRPAPVSGTLTGLYVDVAGGSLFTDCETSREWPVVSGTTAGELDRAYLLARGAPGHAARVTVRAHSTRHDGVQGGHDSVEGGKEGLVIDSVVMLTGESTCPGQRADASLSGTTWRALELEGRPVAAAQGAITLRLDAETRSIRVSAVCRGLTGTFRWVGTELTFGSVEALVRRCPATVAADSAAAIDAVMLDVLRTTGSYRIRGDTLDLMGESGSLARFTVAGEERPVGTGADPPPHRSRPSGRPRPEALQSTKAHNHFLLRSSRSSGCAR